MENKKFETEKDKKRNKKLIHEETDKVTYTANFMKNKVRRKKLRNVQIHLYNKYFFYKAQNRFSIHRNSLSKYKKIYFLAAKLFYDSKVSIHLPRKGENAEEFYKNN